MSVDLISFTEISPQPLVGVDLPTSVGAISVTQVTVGLTGLPGSGGGGGGGGSYTHTQSVASASWTVNHNLGYRPAISALSVGGVVMLASVVHVSVNQAVISFDQPVPGFADCS